MADAASNGSSAPRVRAAEIEAEQQDETPFALHPLRFLGMGLLITWLCCTHIPSIYIDASSVIRLSAEYGMRVGDIGTVVVLAIAAQRIGALSQHRAACAISVALTTAGTAVVGLVLAPAGIDAIGAVFLLSVIVAIGGAVLFCLWAEIFCQMGTTSMIIYGGSSCVTALLVYFLISTMMQPYALIATALLPLLSLAFARASFKVVPRETPHTAETRYPVPWKIVAIMAIAGILSGSTGVILGEFLNLGAVHRIWAMACAGALLAYVAMRRPGAFDLRLMTRVCLATSVVAFLLLPLASSGLAEEVSFLVKFAYVWFTVFTLALLANLAYRFDLPSLRLFAIARACNEGGIFLGVSLREVLHRSAIELDTVALSIAALIGLVIVGVCVLIWRSEKAVNAGWGAAGISLASGEHEPGPRERLIRRCERIAEEYGLTEREREMLLLIGQGKTRGQIEQELFLSQNTVKTHIRHLYGKLDVHSKEEACALLGVE